MYESNPSIALRNLIVEEQVLLLQSILGAVDVGVMLTDLEHQTLAVNERFGEIFGVEIKAAVISEPEKVRDFVRNKIRDYEAWKDNLEAVYSDPKSSQEDLLFLQNPHQVLSRNTKPILDSSRNAFARLWTFTDITLEHHRHEIEELLSQMSMLFDPDPKAVYQEIVQSLSKFYDSTAILSILACDVVHFQAIASPIEEVAAMQSNTLADSYCQFCMDNDKPIIIQNALDHPIYSKILPATVGVTRYAGVPLRTSQGHVIGTLCVLDHHSDRIHRDEDLRLLSLMAMRVSAELEREAHLSSLKQDLVTAESKMIQNEKLAVTGTLAASIAHDIRNIVSAITIDLSGDHDTPANKLKQAQYHIDRFNVLALQLLSYAKPKEVTRQSMDVEDSISKVTELLTRHLQLAKIELTTHFAPNFPLVKADPGRIEHLFMNICLNAIQAMKTGGNLRISGEVESEHVVVTIQDSGPGMSPEQISTAFQPFTSSRRDVFGLGLYSCKQIMKESGGTIGVESSEKGSTFKLQFQKP